MTLPRNKRERIKQRLANREPWAAIKKEEHVCFDTISRIRKEPLSPPADRALQAGDTPQVKQRSINHTQPPSLSNHIFYPNIKRMEQKVDLLGTELRTSTKDIQDVKKIVREIAESQYASETKGSPKQKFDNLPSQHEIMDDDTKTKSAPTINRTVEPPTKDPIRVASSKPETKMNTSHSIDFKDQKIPDMNLGQTNTSPTAQDDKDQNNPDYINDWRLLGGIFIVLYGVQYAIDFYNFYKTGQFPVEKYLQYQKKNIDPKIFIKPNAYYVLRGWTDKTGRLTFFFGDGMGQLLPGHLIQVMDNIIVESLDPSKKRQLYLINNNKLSII